MSIKSKFKQDVSKANEGVWFDYPANADGSIPRVKLARFGRSNKRWLAAFREATKDLDTDNLSPEEDFQITVQVFCESVLQGWENMQPEDDGKPLDFTVGNAITFLSNPEWT
ncbi:MAG TPA: hypothetical protein VN081_04480, partial [Dongiaceae bacterium]|nr:hypothetical protein [Dongiaceae bacterium]